MAQNVHCLIEIPKGSRNKSEWDEELGAIKLDRFLFSSVVYPTDYGFILETLGEDGDPLDAMVCMTEPTFPGCVIPVKVIGLLRMRDDEAVDDKVVCVPEQRRAGDDRRHRALHGGRAVMSAPPAIARPAAPERRSTTGLTKPECHCRHCLAALVAQYRPRPA